MTYFSNLHKRRRKLIIDIHEEAKKRGWEPREFGYRVNHFWELFLTGVPELDEGLEESFGFHRIHDEPRKCVYLIGFTDETVKVGVSANPQLRIATVSKQSGRTVANHFVSESMPSKDAFGIEGLMKKILCGYRLEGEFFKISFKKVRGLLEHYLVDHNVHCCLAEEG